MSHSNTINELDQNKRCSHDLIVRKDKQNVYIKSPLSPIQMETGEYVTLSGPSFMTKLIQFRFIIDKVYHDDYN